ncbi:hypothetical protein [Streptomyces olivochromogenes]|uniref:hypothetical protein n=1 Tax=Streptomyces olivochromogenes TaxID=1963 RepID=UPI0036BAA9A5
MDELPVHQGWLRRRWRSVAVLGAVFAPAGGGALYAELRPVFPRTDARACSDGTVPPAEPADFDTWGGPEALGATRGVLEDGFSDRQTTSGRLAATPYGLRLIVNIDPDSRPRPAVLVALEEA